MTIYLATNSARDVGGSYGQVSTAGRFDSDYVSDCVLLKMLTNVATPAYIGHHADVSGDRISWFHYDMYTPTTFTTQSDGSVMRGRDSDGDVMFTCMMVDGSITPWCFNKAGASSSGSTFMLPVDLNTYDIFFSDDGVTAVFELYANGVVIGASTQASSGIRPGMRTVQFDNNDMVITSTDAFISQIICANESTVGMKMQEILPSGVGNYTDISATSAEVADDDGTTGWTSAVATDKQSFVVAGYAVPAARLIHSVLPGFAMRTGQTGPQNIRPFVRIGGVDYAGPADIGPVGNAKQGFVGHAWALNPATGVAWTAGEIAALDAGFEVKA